MRLIAYYRVSTQQQGRSGLGLEAQRAIVESHARVIEGEIIAEHIEIETGTKKKQRPVLDAAIEQCKDLGATLIIAKLDRLSRDAKFTLNVVDSGIEIVFCDFPQINRLILTILAAIAEYEAELISTRTKNALKALKARGVKLGNPNIDKARQHIKPRKKTIEKNHTLTAIQALRKTGQTWQTIADELNSAKPKRGEKKFKFSPGRCYNLLNAYSQQQHG